MEQDKGIARALCFINKKRISAPNLSARVLVIKCGMDHLSDQYLSLVNCAFGAQEMDVKIDAVVIDREGNNAALQQVISQSMYFEPCLFLRCSL